MFDEKALSRRTICFPILDDRIILGMKLKGFGVGKYNGFGGKFDASTDKVIEETAIRELYEESNLAGTVSDLDKRAVLDFIFPAKPAFNQRVHVYFLFKFSGESRQTEEMRPEEFLLKNIPYAKMWDSDKIWLPLLLGNKSFHATFYWKDDNETVDKYDIIYTKNLPVW